MGSGQHNSIFFFFVWSLLDLLAFIIVSSFYNSVKNIGFVRFSPPLRIRFSINFLSTYFSHLSVLITSKIFLKTFTEQHWSVFIARGNVISDQSFHYWLHTWIRGCCQAPCLAAVLSGWSDRSSRQSPAQILIQVTDDSDFYPLWLDPSNPCRDERLDQPLGTTHRVLASISHSHTNLIDIL